MERKDVGVLVPLERYEELIEKEKRFEIVKGVIEASNKKTIKVEFPVISRTLLERHIGVRDKWKEQYV